MKHLCDCRIVIVIIDNNLNIEGRQDRCVACGEKKLHGIQLIQLAIIQICVVKAKSIYESMLHIDPTLFLGTLLVAIKSKYDVFFHITIS